MLLDLGVVHRVWFVSKRSVLDKLDKFCVHFDPFADYSALIVNASPEWLCVVRCAERRREDPCCQGLLCVHMALIKCGVRKGASHRDAASLTTRIANDSAI